MSRPCPHCGARIDHFACRWMETSRVWGTYSTDYGHDSHDSEAQDDYNYEYSCPECDRYIEGCDNSEDCDIWLSEAYDAEPEDEPAPNIWTNVQ